MYFLRSLLPPLPSCQRVALFRTRSAAVYGIEAHLIQEGTSTGAPYVPKSIATTPAGPPQEAGRHAVTKFLRTGSTAQFAIICHGVWRDMNSSQFRDLVDRIEYDPGPRRGPRLLDKDRDVARRRSAR